MTAQEVLQEARRRGVELTPLPDGKLHYRPTSRVDPEFLEALRRHKSRLLQMLSTRPCSGCGRFRLPEPTAVCYWCRLAAAMEVKA